MSSSVSPLDDAALKCIETFVSDSTTDVSKLYEKEYSFITNVRGQKIHVRHYLPSTDPKLIIFYLHGYGDHNNHLYLRLFADEFNQLGAAVVAFDFHGHGLSEGEYLLTQADHLTQDTISVIMSTYRQYNYACNFIIMGGSMGGLVASSCGLELTRIASSMEQDPLYDVVAGEGEPLRDAKTEEKAESIAKHFAGCILMCPALTLKLPPPTVICLLKYCIVPCFPHTSVPAILSPPEFRSDQLSGEKYFTYLKRNSVMSGFNGMNKGTKVKFRTALTFIEMMDGVAEKIKNIQFPFLVMHDPDDEVVPFRGSQQLIEESLTPNENKELVEFAEGKHALVPNRIGLVVKHSIRWLREKGLFEDDKMPGEISSHNRL